MVDAFNLNIVWPMLPFMVESYNVAADEEDLGAWVGFAAGRSRHPNLEPRHPNPESNYPNHAPYPPTSDSKAYGTPKFIHSKSQTLNHNL